MNEPISPHHQEPGLRAVNHTYTLRIISPFFHTFLSLTLPFLAI
jgi:hypothetical protein